MSNFTTVVIEYEEGAEQPSFHANMDLLGGKVTGVMFADALKALEIVETELDEANEKTEDLC